MQIYKKMTRTKILLIVMAAATLLIFIISSVQTVSQGDKIFMREGCLNCHSFKGHGGALAPDLTSVTQRRSMIWIINQIKNPKSHNPDSRMPEFKHVSLAERLAIALFLKG
jgi:cbb3-type cytochrome oxidase cytochrome c subunit